ncbi:cysteine-rich receptor-like protein kinase 26 [Triticum dicoccoides]|uniref:cysteine-rich receptor-like protein kinase 26 n=1 Tax=Triticum dicoccoides TaxID=85692 RepID=UPI001891C00C|nr:cysteine-rich receptor-like protein kinase 26 [Triticum dicoccoides]
MATEGKIQERKFSPELQKKISLQFLKKITKDFSDDQKICRDAFGTLYKGILDDDQVIAIKKLEETALLAIGKAFDKEVQHIMDLKHENVVELVGYCSEVEMKVLQVDGKYINAEITESLLCYEYLPNGSLHDYLFGTTEAQESSSAERSIHWDGRFKIIKGICKGLLFLHNLDNPIIHMDLNHNSIWLGENMEPKIGNFGLSRLFGHDQTRMRTETVVGSCGYMAPEYIYDGVISAQADIYSLGLMIIEISTGEKNHPDDKQLSGREYIEIVRRKLLEDLKIRMDWTAEHIASVYSSYDAERLQQVYACIEIGLECVQLDRTKRPPIEKIVDRFNTV